MLGLRKLAKQKAKRTHQNYSERRGKKEDRRSFGPPTQFPFIDSNGKLVKVDRRTMPDRRLANIQVKEDHLHFDKCRFTGKPS